MRQELPTRSKHRVVALAAALLMLGGAAIAGADVIVPGGSGGWRYTIVAHDAAPAGFETEGFDDSGWDDGTMPFGDFPIDICGLSDDVATLWPVQSELLLRRTVVLEGCETSLVATLSIDNDVQVFFNGTDVSGGLLVHEGCADTNVLNIPIDPVLTPGLVINAGNNLLAVRARDRGQVSFLDLELTGDIPAEGCNPQPPLDCGDAAAGPGVLWPPNHKFRSIQVTGVDDAEGNPAEIEITGITQDEHVRLAGTGSGNTCPDATGVGGSSARVRAERSGQGNGRVYQIEFTATADDGATCEGAVRVCVPHDQGNRDTCIDDGQLFDSTVCP